MIKVRLALTLLIIFSLISCSSLAPGMHMNTSSSLVSNNESVYVESIDKKIEIQKIAIDTLESLNFVYKIGNGDQLSITVWGLADIFPVSNINPDQNLRRVDSNGNIYFPYVGLIKAAGKTQNELRKDLTVRLSSNFNNPQLDLSIARFNSQKVYILGEVTKPSKINITDIPISLTDAMGEVSGINTNSGNGSEVYVIRQAYKDNEPMIFRADLASPAGFLAAGSFYLEDNDIIYVNAKGTIRWNRVISQFFPFSTFLNSIDNLSNSD